MAFRKAVEEDFRKYIMRNPLNRRERLENRRRSFGTECIYSVKVSYSLGTVRSRVAHGESDEVWEKLVQGIA